MSYQEQRYDPPSHSSKTGDYPYQNISMYDSSTFVKPLQDGSLHSTSVYTNSTGTAIPPPPLYLYQQLPHQPKRKRGYIIAIALLTLLVEGLGTLEVFQVAGWNLLAHDPHRSLGSNQSSRTSARHTSTSQRATPVHTLTPGTIKVNITLAAESVMILSSQPLTPSPLI